MSIRYQGDTRRFGSGIIWDKWDLPRIAAGLCDVIGIDERFPNPPVFASGVSQAGFITYQDTGATIQGIAEAGGVLRFSTSNTDNDEANLTLGGNVGAPFIIDTAATKRLSFEFGVRFGQITEHGAFIGLSEEGLAAADSLTDDDGALASKDFVGFHVDTAGPTALDAVHRKAGGAATVVAAAAQTLVASTWYRLGFDWNPKDPDGKVARWYVNGTEVGSITDASVATFPDGEELTPTVLLKTGEAVDKTMDIDFIRVLMEV